MQTYIADIVHALKVGFFLTFFVLFLALVAWIVKAAKDENQNNL